MPLAYADRVKETTATTGTGTLTLAGAVAGYRTFTSALSTGAVVTYCIEEGVTWEVGEGTFTTSGATLTRTLIASSTGSLLNLSGAATVFLTLSARDVIAEITHASGNVGIGTTTPDEALQVVGSIKLSGSIKDETYIGTNIALDNDLTISANRDVIITSANFKSDGKIGIGTTTPTAALHLKAGSATANTAPLKLTSGPLLTVVEEGAIEYLGHTFYATTFQVRRSIVLAQEVVVADVTVANTTTETTIYSIPMAANYLTVGKRIKVELNGIFSTVGNNANGVFTLRAKYAGATIFTIASAQQAATNRPYNMDFYTTCRAIGSGTTGKLKSSGHLSQDITADVLVQGALTDVDTTVTNTIEVTVQWATANASNSFTVSGGDTTCVDNNA